MDLQFRTKSPEFLHFLIMVLIFATLTIKARSAAPKFSPCQPQNCGTGPNISYPFWIPQQQESYCGSPKFNITCYNKSPILKLSGDDYIIRNINYASNSVLLENSKVFDQENSCPIPLHNFSSAGTPFSYAENLTELYFFYNCTFLDEFATYTVDCASNDSHHSFAVFHTELLKKEKYSVELCEAVVNAPVSALDINILLEMNYTDILQKGFVLEWNGVDCGKCVKSGGKCGSLDNEFICVCNDEPRLGTCGKNNHLGLKIGIGFGAAGFGIVSSLLAFCIYNRRKKTVNDSSLISRNVSSYPSSMSDFEKGGTFMGVPIFTYNELEKATNNFDSNKELGDGGFGTVYKGKLQDGRVVAVKRLYENNFKRVEQFMNEIEILTRLRHQNLVSLYGCTSQHCRQLLLVYEYIPNGTVADHLHGEHAKPGVPTWKTRMRIAIETASALSYLHASDVIHRDVKTTNILLDNNFCVKVADFGLSRLFPLNVTHISTSPQGTPGYVDPEYHECYQLTNKSDVYSFGVVLIELISSKPAVDISRHRHEINLSNMAINKIQTGALHELVDLSLGFESDYEVRKMITEVAELAFQCLQSGREFRPSMQEVLKGLKRIQSKYYDNKSHVEADLLADDASMLKNNPQILSPDSVTVKWASNSNSTMSGSSS